MTASSAATPPHAEHFDSYESQAHAARLGMWIFLGSELLLFAGLFALYAAYRARDPAAFVEGVHHDTKVLGTINTAILLVSSTLAALGVHALREGRRRAAVAFVASTVVLGGVFFAIKMTEWAQHFADGIAPGARGRFFVEHPAAGLPTFWNLYFAMTGLHVLHVLVGMTALGCAAVGVLRGTITAERPTTLENCTLLWHLVDLVWIFLWPLFYLA